MRQNHRISLKSQISVIVTITMVLGLLSSLLVHPAQAETIRTAQIEKVIGIVHIQEAGGVKAYRAYNGMVLQHGDHIKTEANSSIVFKVSDRGDEITIDEKSELYISDLRNESGNMKTKFYIWSGSMWIKASTLVNSEDEFEIETPTAFMGVRGTTLLVGVDPETGESKFYIASGQGEVNKKGDEASGSGTTLNPNEQLRLDEDTDSEDYDDYTSVADLDDLINNTSNAIIEAIIASKAEIDKENEEYIAILQKEQDATGNTTQQEVIDRINQNLNNLVGNIVKNAISQNKVDEEEIKAFIERINQQLDKKLDLNNVKAQELSEQEKAKQARIKLLEEERKKKQEAEKLKQEELKKQHEALQEKLKAQLEKQKAAKEKAEEAAKKKAAEEYAKKLKDAAAKAAFEAKQQAIAAEKKKQEEAAAEKNKKDAVSDAANKPGTSISEPEPGSESESESGSDSDSLDKTPPALTIVSPTYEYWNNTGSLDIVVQTEQSATVTLSTYGTDTILATGIGQGLGTNVTLNIADLAEGEYAFTVKAIDAVGNVTTQTVPTIIVDTTPPVIEVFQVSAETPYPLPGYVEFMSEQGATIQILHDGVLVGSGIGEEDSVVQIILDPLPVGIYRFTIVARDAAGNQTSQDAEDYNLLNVYLPEP